MSRISIFLIGLTKIISLSYCQFADNGPPKFTVVPLDQRVAHNSQVFFSCKVTGTPEPTLRWKKNGRKLSNGRNRQIFTTGTSSVLVLNDVSKSTRFEGEYECVADNGVGQPISHRASLQVYDHGQALPRGYPEVTKSFERSVLVVEQGFPMMLPCSIKGNPKPAIQWYKDKMPLEVESDNSIQILTPDGDPDAFEFHISKTEERHSGKYLCIGRNRHGVRYSNETDVHIRVRTYPPQFTVLPRSNYTVTPGDNLNLTCVAIGSPMPYVSWVYKGNRVGEGGETTETTPIGRNFLQLTNIQEAGNYTCRGSSAMGHVKFIVHINIEALPGPPTAIRVNSVQPGSVTVQWNPPFPKPDSQPTSELTYYVEFRTKFGAEDVVNDWSARGEDVIGKSLKYEITGLLPWTQYEVRVLPVTQYGTGTPSEILLIQTDETVPTTPPREITARSVSRYSALIKWKPPLRPNGEITEYMVYTIQHVEPLPTFDSNEWTKTPVSHDMHVASLEDGVSYSIALQARTAVGWGPISEPILFRQRAYVPYAPQNVQATEITKNSIGLTWDRPEHYRDNELLSYEIYINNSRTRQPQIITVIPPEEHFVLTGLYPNTIYNIQVMGRSQSGVGAHSTIIQEKTLEAAPTQPPMNVVAVAIKDRAKTLNVSWTPPSSDTANGMITGYQLSYVLVDERFISRIPNGPETHFVNITDAQTLNYIIEDLKVWTQYNITLRAVTLAGLGPPSRPVTGRTGEFVPGAPRSFSVSALNASAILAQWRKPNPRETNGIIRGYQLYYVPLNRTTNMRVGQPILHQVLGGDATNTTIGNLEPKTRYMVSIAAFTVAGDGQHAKTKVVETFGQVPSAPLNIRVETIETEPIQVKVVWDPPADPHGEIINYEIGWSERDNGISSPFSTGLNGNIHEYIINALAKGREYEFKVRAKNGENWGVWAVEFFRTEDGVPSGMAQNITATYRNDTTALVSWSPPHPDLQNGVIIMYQIRYYDKDDPIDVNADNTSETSILLDELTAGNKYYIQLVPFTSAGAGPTSHRVLYNTIPIRVAAPLSVQAERISPTSIRVTWAQPGAAVRGYRVYYNTDTIAPLSEWTIHNVNSPVTNTMLENLDPTSGYVIKVQALDRENKPGRISGPEIVNEVNDRRTTKEQVQSLAENHVTSTTINIRWRPPTRAQPNQIKISCVGTDLRTGQRHSPTPQTVNSQITEYLIRSLKPRHSYEITVSVKYAGEQDYIGERAITVSTKGVAVPQLKKEAGSATIAFSREENNYNMIYVIVVSASEVRPPQEISMNELLNAHRLHRAVAEKPYIAAAFPGDGAPSEFTIGDGVKYGEYLNRELVDGVVYKSFVRVEIEDGEYYSSKFSNEFTATGPVTAAVSEAPVTPQETNILYIVAPISAFVIIGIVLVIVILVIRRNKAPKKEKAPEPQRIDMDQPPNYPNDPVELRRMNYSTPGMQKHPPIPVTALSTHIDRLRENDNCGFSQEYECIEPGQQFTWDHSNLEYNKPKNRYANVIAYDHSRVVLQPFNGIEGTDYINANYMDGYRKQNAYISTQGPLPDTFGDFWRMVWEQRSSTIVMMTKLEERARIKCDMYWPSEVTDLYDDIQVTETDCMELATYTVRTFQIQKQGYGEKREVRQFQYTAWPDHGVPDYPTPLLIFMRRVKASTPSDSGPMIVHCSAGVGRTGAFIVIDSMLERIKNEKHVDIYGHVTCLRAQRNYMVQTEDQYIFIHDALLEAVLSGNTEIQAKNLYAHIQKLAQPDPSSLTGMEQEFKRLSHTMKVNSSRFVSANLPVNKFKNRLVNSLPYESNRVALQPIRGVDGSDYINASFVDGYRFKQAYIATQGPLQETTEDFWRMLWEHNSTIVVMLTKTREMGRDKCYQYWPDTRSQRYQYFVVDPHAEYNMQEYTLREFKVTDARDGQSRTIRLFQFNEWPDQGAPQSGMSFIQFIGQVHKTKEQFGQEGPITVHCSAGVGRTGVFIALSIVLERMRYEGVVDMFQTVKMLRTQRQGMVQSEDQYGFCYQAALEHLASFDQY